MRPVLTDQGDGLQHGYSAFQEKIMIGILGALTEEIEGIETLLDISEIREKAGSRFICGNLGGKPVTVVKCGVGKVNAAICTQVLIDVFGCTRIIFSGVAGALLPGLRQGDIVVSSHVVQFDVDLTAFGRRRGEIADKDRLIEADPEMVEAAGRAFDQLTEEQEAPPIMMVGTIVSGDSFVSDPATIKWLQREFSAACTEMEGGAVGYTCMLNQVPFVVCRMISDSADNEAAGTFEAFLPRASAMLCELAAGTVQQLP